MVVLVQVTPRPVHPTVVEVVLTDRVLNQVLVMVAEIQVRPDPMGHQVGMVPGVLLLDQVMAVVVTEAMEEAMEVIQEAQMDHLMGVNMGALLGGQEVRDMGVQGQGQQQGIVGLDMVVEVALMEALDMFPILFLSNK